MLVNLPVPSVKLKLQANNVGVEENLLKCATLEANSFLFKLAASLYLTHTQRERKKYIQSSEYLERVDQMNYLPCLISYSKVLWLINHYKPPHLTCNKNSLNHRYHLFLIVCSIEVVFQDLIAVIIRNIFPHAFITAFQMPKLFHTCISSCQN